MPVIAAGRTQQNNTQPARVQSPRLFYMNKQEHEKELWKLRRHCNWGISIGVLAVLINAINMYLAWSKVL